MNPQVLLVHPDDDMLVALQDHAAGQLVEHNGHRLTLPMEVPAKQKLALRAFDEGQSLRMYGITVGKALKPIAPGELLTTQNLEHATDEIQQSPVGRTWQGLDVSAWRDRTFEGYRRGDGKVGTANCWIVVPMVFCENRNLQVMKDALLEELGYERDRSYQSQTRRLIEQYRKGAAIEQILEATFEAPQAQSPASRVFPNVDGVRFLTHVLGCGGTYQDANELCGLLAGYINHPNVAGATVMSLGCQKSQVADLQDELHRRNPEFDKPLYIFEQQKMASEQSLLTEAIKHTFAGLVAANECTREPAPISELCIGVECGGSDGFSGLSANPAIGHCSDLTIGSGGSVILSEFPELAGCEQDIVERCVDQDTAGRFIRIMDDYSKLAVAVGSGFESNPGPGNIRDGLITDAIKSAGAARKGGTSPVVDVFDYPGFVRRRGLNLMCTPGGDVESTTAMAGAGANIILFSTGLGTPTGNVVCPVIKISSNSDLAMRLADMIDLDAGGIITGKDTIEQIGEQILDLVIETASGRYATRAQRLGQEDFIPWKRGISL